jgi:hypothetical protein
VCACCWLVGWPAGGARVLIGSGGAGARQPRANQPTLVGHNESARCCPAGGGGKRWRRQSAMTQQQLETKLLRAEIAPAPARVLVLCRPRHWRSRRSGHHLNLSGPVRRQLATKPISCQGRDTGHRPRRFSMDARGRLQATIEKRPPRCTMATCALFCLCSRRLLAAARRRPPPAAVLLARQCRSADSAQVRLIDAAATAAAK